MPDKAQEYFVQALQLVPEDSPLTEEIEEEIYNIYRCNMDKQFIFYKCYSEQCGDKAIFCVG